MSSHFRPVRSGSYLAAGCILLSSVLPSCGGGGGGDVKAPFGPPTPTTTFTLEGAIPWGEMDTVFGGVVGERQFGTVTVNRYKLSDRVGSLAELQAPGAPGTEFWFRLESDDTFVFVGGGGADSSVTVDEPILADLNPPVGVPQPLERDVTIKLSGDPVTKAARLTGSYLLVETDVSVETDVGTVHGCRHYTATGTATSTELTGFEADLILGRELTVEIWHHPDFGIVAGSMPLLNVGIGLAGSEDCGEPVLGSRGIRKVAVLDAERQVFDLDTHACSGEFDADKNTHARMLLELRWADDEDAKTKPAPDPIMARVEFGTVWGSFPFTLIESSFSIFHPEENGKGYRYWYALVDEAARNEPGGNGIAYHIRVTIDPSLTPLRATGRIIYNSLP